MPEQRRVPFTQRVTQGFPLALDFPESNEVHLWSVTASLDHNSATVLSEVLSPDERARGQRYIVPKVCQRFIQTRGLLRVLLGAYLQIAPGKLTFHYSENGKPSLLGLRKEALLQFNVSHSQDQILYAVTLNQAIGVDIEAINSATGYQDLARRICTPQEWDCFSTLSPSEQFTAFFKIWTRKEAWVKLSGDRLYEKLQVLSVPVFATSGSYWVKAADQRIWLQDLDLVEGFAAAIALPTVPTQIIHHEWRHTEEPS